MTIKKILRWPQVLCVKSKGLYICVMMPIYECCSALIIISFIIVNIFVQILLYSNILILTAFLS